MYNQKILNPRPIGQNAQLNRLIRNSGGVPISLPALTIVELDKNKWIHLLPALSQIEQAIFTSTNAVNCFFTALTEYNIVWPNSIIVIAIGRTTAKALSFHGIMVHFTPKTADSEHLLQLTTLQSIRNNKLLLIKGCGGRQLISEILTSRAANLTTIAVYDSIIPHYNQRLLYFLWQQDMLDVLLFTSHQIMRNIFTLFGAEAISWLQSKSCIVISQRLANAASMLGMRKILVIHDLLEQSYGCN